MDPTCLVTFFNNVITVSFNRLIRWVEVTVKDDRNNLVFRCQYGLVDHVSIALEKEVEHSGFIRVEVNTGSGMVSKRIFLKSKEYEN